VIYGDLFEETGYGSQGTFQICQDFAQEDEEGGGCGARRVGAEGS
jgi:hypothetical protein